MQSVLQQLPASLNSKAHSCAQRWHLSILQSFPPRWASTWRPAAPPAAAWRAASQILGPTSASSRWLWRHMQPAPPPSKLIPVPNAMLAAPLVLPRQQPLALLPPPALARQAHRLRRRLPAVAAPAARVWILSLSRACPRQTSCWPRQPPLEQTKRAQTGGIHSLRGSRMTWERRKHAGRAYLFTYAGSQCAHATRHATMQATPACILHRQPPACKPPQRWQGAHRPSLPILRPEACHRHREQQSPGLRRSSRWQPPLHHQGSWAPAAHCQRSHPCCAAPQDVTRNTWCSVPTLNQVMMPVLPPHHFSFSSHFAPFSSSQPSVHDLINRICSECRLPKAFHECHFKCASTRRP